MQLSLGPRQDCNQGIGQDWVVYLESGLGKGLLSSSLPQVAGRIHFFMVVKILPTCFFKASKGETSKMGWCYTLM